MALLQIAEPGLSTAPHQHRLAVGIDLGTTHSLVATVRSGSAACLPDSKGRIILPSVVRYGPQGVRNLGEDALACADTDPLNTIYSAKRLMGRGFADVANLQLPYRLHPQEGMVGIATEHGIKSPVQVSADLLHALRQRAEDSLGGPLVGAVITVPAYFDDAQRQATKDAAQLAGIHVLRLLNEPTAAAVAYGLDNQSQGHFVVFDLGGGTFDVSVLRLQAGVFEVLATGGDSQLGGDDVDRLLAQHYIQTHKLGQLSNTQLARLTMACRRAKEQLSQAHTAFLSVDLHPQETLAETLSTETFNTLVQPLVQRTLNATRKTLRDANLSLASIDGVVLVGGSTRMPVVRQAVAEFFGQAPLTNLNPDEVVAIGAAIQANALAGNKQGEDLLLLDVTPLSLGLETLGDLTEVIIPRNSTIPVARAQEFTTHQDGQTALAVHVVQGERERTSLNRSLARFELRGIPPMVAGAARIRIVFQVDADGLLQVSATETSTGVSAQITVKPSYGLGDSQIASMLQDSFTQAEVDMQTRKQQELHVDGLRLLESVQAALAKDAHLLEPKEHSHIQALAKNLQACLQSQSARAQQHTGAKNTEPKNTDPQNAELENAQLQHAIDKLQQATESFAAQRMNAGIQNALVGKTMADVETTLCTHPTPQQTA